jgi:hypothetical protein
MELLLITPIYLMSKKVIPAMFVAFALLAFAAMLYHTYGALKPFDATPAWRHSLFIAINIICIYGLLKRPDWFVCFWAILSLQQLYSHGSHFLKLLSENKFTLIDFGVLLLMPLIFVLLLIDRKSSVNT